MTFRSKMNTWRRLFQLHFFHFDLMYVYWMNLCLKAAILTLLHLSFDMWKWLLINSVIYGGLVEILYVVSNWKNCGRLTRPFSDFWQFHKLLFLMPINSLACSSYNLHLITNWFLQNVVPNASYQGLNTSTTPFPFLPVVSWGDLDSRSGCGYAAVNKYCEKRNWRYMNCFRIDPLFLQSTIYLDQKNKT